MKVNYTKSKFVKEEYQFEIEDIHNCFLQGQREDTNITEYLGIYKTQKYLLIIEIQNQTNIIMQHYENKGVYTDNDIRDFLKRHTKVKEITKNIFKSKLNNIVEVILC